MKPTKKFTREEEILMQDFSGRSSSRAKLFFYVMALIASVSPIWLYWRIFDVSLQTDAVIYVLGTLLSTFLLSHAYKLTKISLKHKISAKRHSSVTREMDLRYGDDKRISKKERDERALLRKHEVAEFEAAAFSIFFINTLFFLCMIICSFFILINFSSTINFIVSITLSAGLAALLSTGSYN